MKNLQNNGRDGDRKKSCTDIGHWWGTCVKPGIQRFFRAIGREKASEINSKSTSTTHVFMIHLKNP
jgi:hypothetical protein